jgi:uncharacterized protein YcfJ
MKSAHRLSLLAALAVSSVVPAAFAQEQGRVISTTPVITQVAVPRQVCTNEVVQTQSSGKSGAGAAIGAVAGGAVGNAVGSGTGRAAATMIGIFGGAILGDKIEGGTPTTQSQTVQRCNTQTFYENRPTAYNVVYEFNGKQYQVQLPQDPGPFVSLQVTPVGVPAAPVIAPAPVIVPAPQVVRPVTVAPVYVEPPVVTSSTIIYTSPAPVYVPAPVVVAPAVVHVSRHPHHYYHGHPRVVQPVIHPGHYPRQPHVVYPHTRHPHHPHRPLM